MSFWGSMEDNHLIPNLIDGLACNLSVAIGAHLRHQVAIKICFYDEPASSFLNNVLT